MEKWNYIFTELELLSTIFCTEYRPWLAAGLIILLLDFGWLIFYYYYATAEIYNLKEKKEYIYLGRLWLKKKQNYYFLNIPEEITDRSFTTRYKICWGSMFAQKHEKEKIRISFADKYDIFTEIKHEITVKNHIATSHKL